MDKMLAWTDTKVLLIIQLAKDMQWHYSTTQTSVAKR